MVNTKKQTLSSQDHSSTTRGRGKRHKCPALIEEVSKRPNQKRRRPTVSSESESEPEYDAQVQFTRSRNQKVSFRRDIYNDSDSDFEETPPKTKPEKMRETKEVSQTESKNAASKNDVSLSLSCSELESDTSEMDVKDKMDDGQPGKSIPPTSSKLKRVGKSTDENRRTRVMFTNEQHELLLAMFRENENPTKEQQEKLAVDAKLSGTQRYTRRISEEKKSKLKQVFAINRNPDKATVSSLASELQMPRDHVIRYFSNMRGRNLIVGSQPLFLSEEKQILMDLFQQNPNFCDYSNPELMEKTGWSIQRVRASFCRLENGITELAGITPLADKEAEAILMDVFKKNPLFDDYRNIELREKIHWPISRVSFIQRWFIEQRNLNRSQVSSHFDEAMESIFQRKQFFGHKSKDLELMTGGSWAMVSIEIFEHSEKIISQIVNWLENKRKNVLQSYFKKEISDLPSEMGKFEELYKKYNSPQTTDPDVIKEGINEKQNGEDVVNQNDEENHIDPEFEYPMDENRSVQPDPHQEAGELEINNDQTEIANPHDALMNESLHGQLEENVADEETGLNPQINGEQIFNYFDEVPEQQNDQIKEKMPPSVRPVNGEMEIPVKVESIEEEENNMQLIVFDVIQEDVPQDTEAMGPVSIVRKQTEFNDLQPYLGDIVGLTEIGFAKKTEMTANKRKLGGDRMDNLILPFNCSMGWPTWSRNQRMEFFGQLFSPETTKKLIEKVKAGYVLTMFQKDQTRYFKNLN
ncbi:Protein CBG10948 [Caenorhabditis briggsae]|uniref:Protein CBG10948 n=1 Tax=Caenorhabditis briggsae TaxID=6238 RepID=A8XBX5_CAEBR|nr:Protein CBG10948 [Caenorhabditis briggsae]CAP30213.2 Protein CBG10948 [Caenorhabditis briggsae]